MKYLCALFAATILLAWPASAHIGSPDVFYEGNAGPYRLFVTVRVPQVIPGVAEVDVRSESPDVDSISIAPMQLTGPGSKYAPTPDVAQRSKADPQSFAGSVWLMEFGSLQVRLQAQGVRGPGSLAVPVPAIAQRTLPMAKPLAALLLVLLAVLAASLVSIAAAAVREGSVAPGASLTAENFRRNRNAMAIAAIVIAVVLFIGWRWWRSDARVYARNIYAPPRVVATIDSAGRLTLTEIAGQIASGNPRRASDLDALDHLIPDHDHLMHLFLVRTPGMDSFWHLHPQPSGTGGFTTDLPALPAGHYKIFADVVLSSGFPMTMLGEIDVPAVAGRALSGDDSAAAAPRIDQAVTPNTASQLSDGGRMVWDRVPAAENSPLKSNVPFSFKFRVEDAAGNPVHDLQPYMGMAAHAEILRSDGSVFAHIHPAGSVSMAALDLAQNGASPAADMQRMDMQGLASTGVSSAAGNSVMQEMPGMSGMAAANGDFDSGPEVSFPYGFPQPGVYRIFVQVKRLNRIETGVFDAVVQ